MTDDVKALIEPAEEWDTRAVQRNPEKAARYISALADALEAATSAPAVDREALVTVLSDPQWKRGSDVREWPEDEAEAYREEGWSEGIEAARAVLVQKQVDALLAALGARDVRDVQAEALERVREEIRALACWAGPVTGRSGFNLGDDEDGEAGARMAVLDILAQAIREARSER